MAWKVTSWRTEALRAAERDARRATRAAARETADATAYLRELERLGERTLAAVRAQRRHEPFREHAELRVERVARPRRASLHDSPLTELFRATAAR